jgi:hypothetical protein
MLTAHERKELERTVDFFNVEPMFHLFPRLNSDLGANVIACFKMQNYMVVDLADPNEQPIIIGHISEATGHKEGTNSMFFDGRSWIQFDKWKNYKWGESLTVSVRFKRITDRSSYMGIVSTGYYNNSCWEIRMGREQNRERIGGVYAQQIIMHQDGLKHLTPLDLVSGIILLCPTMVTTVLRIFGLTIQGYHQHIKIVMLFCKRTNQSS